MGNLPLKHANRQPQGLWPRKLNLITVIQTVNHLQFVTVALAVRIALNNPGQGGAYGHCRAWVNSKQDTFASSLAYYVQTSGVQYATFLPLQPAIR